MKCGDSESINYERVSDALIQHVPELKAEYDAELVWWGEQRPGPHVIYGDILNPYLDRALETGSGETVQRTFEFLELLAVSADERVRDLVLVSVVAHLCSNKERLLEARSFMGPATLRQVDARGKKQSSGTHHAY